MSKKVFFKIGLMKVRFQLANESDIISSKYGTLHTYILCRRVNGNRSSIKTYLVELMIRINLSIEGRLHE